MGFGLEDGRIWGWQCNWPGGERESRDGEMKSGKGEKLRRPEKE